ncbi:MAG: hypothetical protein ACYTE2_07675, partial [Planctomycetota bacterium]
MTLTLLLLFVVLALAALAGSASTQDRGVRYGLFALAPVLLVVGVLASSVRFVAADEVGIVTKNALGPQLTDGRIVATGGEMGVQAQVLSPGWHLGYWPFLYDVDSVPLVEIESGEVGLVESRDGTPLD